MRRSTVWMTISLATALGVSGWVLWPSSDPGDPAAIDPPAVSDSPEPPASSARLPETPAVDSPPPATGSEPDGARMAIIQSNPELLERARQQRLASAAEARWSAAVEEGRYSAEDIDPSIRRFFEALDLEPRYLEGGEIEGLVIQGFRPEHPLAEAGFRVGDRISRLQGVPLNDPAEIPSLLARLGPHFTICSLRSGREHCADIALD